MKSFSDPVFFFFLNFSSLFFHPSFSKSGKQLVIKGLPFISHGLNLVTWPYPAARDVGKCSLEQMIVYLGKSCGWRLL